MSRISPFKCSVTYLNIIEQFYKRMNEEPKNQCKYNKSFPDSSVGKEPACNVGDPGSIPGLGRSPGEGKGHPLQYPGLENSMDCTVHGVAKGQTQRSDFHFHHKEIFRQCPAVGAAKDAEKAREKKIRQEEGRLKEQQEREGKAGESKGQEEVGKSAKCKKHLHEVLG